MRNRSWVAPATFVALVGLLWAIDSLRSGDALHAPHAGDAPQIAAAERPTAGARDDMARLLEAIRRHESDVVVEIAAPVVHLLPDDRRGSRHQRFLIEVAPHQSVLVAHNIDLAPRIDALREGDLVVVRGEFEWNEKGGVLHWTHHDPDGHRPGGFVRHDGRTYH